MASKQGFNVGDIVASHYVVKEKIGVGGMGAVYRALPFQDPSHDVAIKIIQRFKALGPDDILRFQQEASLMSLLHHPNIICFHELGLLSQTEGEGMIFKNEHAVSGDGYYIVMEIADGRDLKKSLKEDSRKDLPFFFEVGLQVSSALDYTHGKNIIHRDIKPQNIVVGETWQEQKGVLVKVLDFGVARLAEVIHSLGDESQGAKKAEVAGTPMYMAPEQTPLVDAPIDHRVDLYSLGCVLYEILAGRAPFIENSREKLMARHAKATPEPLSSIRPDVPPIIESIVMKLLEKHPNDRYQTAFGLHADLQRAKIKLFNSRSPLVDFPLGLKDGFKAVSAQLKLVGRAQELDRLIRNYEDVSSARGRSHMAVITGDSGMGKTRLLAEVRTYLARGKIRFISASFSRHENNLPFNALANGFNEYLMRLIKGQPHEAEELRRKVKTVLGSAAYSVANIVPGLQLFIDEDVPRESEIINYEEEEEANTEEREFQAFAKAFSDFTRCLAMDKQPVVFIMDDIHWADENSLSLVDQFFSHNNSQRFYLIISYRPSFLEFFPQLKVFIEKFAKLKRRYIHESLEPFNQHQIAELVGNMLDSPHSVSKELVEYLEEKTNGNPMYLVELLRTLVAQEKINYSNINKSWTYDVSRLRQEIFRLDSVDLTVSRIQTYNKEDREVLEVASIIGMSFQFELLCSDRRIESIRATRALRRAIDEGLISRTTDDHALRHLGKAYRFIHPKAREAILDTVSKEDRGAIHQSIAFAQERAMQGEVSESVLFSIVHHVNQALDNIVEPSDRLVNMGIKYNILAGEAAMERASWAQARGFLEKTEVLFSDEHRKKSVQVTEYLGDIESHLKMPKKALKYYHKLLQSKLSRSKFSEILCKVNALTIYGGKVTDSFKMMRKGLKRLKMEIPSHSWMRTLVAGVRLALDMVPFSLNRSRLYNVIQKAYYIGSQKGVRSKDFRFFGLTIYRQGQLILLKENPRLALTYHDTLIQDCINRETSPDTILRCVADRSFLMGYFGIAKTSYYLLDIALDVARSLGEEGTEGYITLYRTLTLDHYRGKHEDLDQKIRKAIRFLGGQSDQFHYALGKIYLIHHDFLKCRFVRLHRSLGFLSGTKLPYRNWLNPRGFAPYLFSLFLKDMRDRLVSDGEKYLECLDEVKARKNEIFVLVIRAIMASTKGEHRRATRCFDKVIKKFLLDRSSGFIERGKGPLLLPFEEDFLAFMILVFPDLHYREHRRPLIDSETSKMVHQKLKTRARGFRMYNRSPALLVLARSAEILEQKQVPVLYDQAIYMAKATGDQLVLLMAYYWFGCYLLKEGRKNEVDYVQKVRQDCRQFGLAALEELAEQTLTEYKIPFERPDYDANSPEASERVRAQLPALSQNHLALLVESILDDNGVGPEWERSLELMKKQYNFKASYVILLDVNSELSLINDQDVDEFKGERAMNYVEPYVNLRSTLFLPVSDSPWHSSGRHQTEVTRVFDKGIDQLFSPADQLDSTLVVEGDQDSTIALSPSTETLRMASSSTLRSNRLEEGAKKRRSSVWNLILPIPFNDRNIGIVFLEDLHLDNTQTAGSRQDLDYFGSQLGLVLNKKLAEASPGVEADLAVQFGNYALEPCSWLDIWSQGVLRKDRDSTWYLGMNLGSNDYLLAYVRLNGVEDIRKPLSAMIWFHLLSLRSLMMSSERISIKMIEIKEEFLKILNSYPNFRQLENLAIAFTVFNRESSYAYSGHIGPSRPLVVGSDNKVKPGNHVLFNLDNGRALRHWSVTAEMGGGKYYILPHDSSKLDIITDNIAPVIEEEGSPEKQLQTILENQLIRDNIPRYYVAAYLSEFSETLKRVD